ncbi:AbrB/MazE/SpoVT family DNA-binding domain-containing protein [Orenia marismortui]|uniref:Transcriptional pleiotropic regulator of transition state genes n=1 Tax=Orenia marismortui TaxID=46469 RepID=A0A4R8H374_9FIRM|nr:AbrB/MazE/SpoVT family DNA-binding domain-containing protein [Orenia marismortui]TDX53180.1 transcriptional pleiotropic regulator of transition state genes [Orenia marismortui]
MKSVGIVRNVDGLGRVVLPKELRMRMGIEVKDPLEIYIDEEKIIFKKYKPACVFCNESDNVVTFEDKKICSNCLEQLLEVKE